MKIKIHQFDPVIYPVKLWIIEKADVELIRSTFCYGDNRDVVIKESEGRICSSFDKVIIHKKTQKYGFLVIIENKEKLTINAISHEATHVVRFIWGYLEEGPTGTEADAYLVGWVAECIEKVKINKS